MAKIHPSTNVSLAQETDVVRLGLGWQSCSDVGGTVEFDHNKMIEVDRHCARCGEATSVTFRPGDRLTLYMKDGKLLRIDVGAKTHILDYPQIKRLTPPLV